MQFRFGTDVITVNTPTADALLSEVQTRLADRRGLTLATLNLDHLVKLRHSNGFRSAYSVHDLVVADGNPVVWLSRLAGRPVALAPGSDLVTGLAHAAREAGAPIALVGATPPALAAAAKTLQRRVEGLTVAARLSPAMGFDPYGVEADRLIDAIADSGARMCFLALGAPRQEIFAARARARLPWVGFASVGAGLDFLAGTQARAPRWVRRLAMEWLWRAASAPRRMVPRYAQCFAILPQEVLAAIRMRGV